MLDCQPAPPRLERRQAFAGFWLRFAAWILDLLILGIPTTLVEYLFFNTTPWDLGGDPYPNWALTIDLRIKALWAIPGALYAILMIAGGGTLGMRALGLRVVTATSHARMGVLRGLIRWLLPVEILWFGYLAVWALTEPKTNVPDYFMFPFLAAFAVDQLWMLSDRRSQTLHDKIAGTLVVRTDVLPPPVTETEQLGVGEASPQYLPVLVFGVLTVLSAFTAVVWGLCSGTAETYTYWPFWLVAAPLGILLTGLFLRARQRRTGTGRSLTVYFWAAGATLLLLSPLSLFLGAVFPFIAVGAALFVIGAQQRNWLLQRCAFAFAIIGTIAMDADILIREDFALDALWYGCNAAIALLGIAMAAAAVAARTHHRGTRRG